MKRLAALIAATIITTIVGVGMLAIGANVLLNPRPVAASGATDLSSAVSTGDSTPDQIASLQNAIVQYQNREKQYQAQLDQAQAQIQEYESVLMQLQRLGIIRINSDGTIQLGRRSVGQRGNGD
jgi:predicted PurR-regulated permease PerM